jgi:hypothetical protein
MTEDQMIEQKIERNLNKLIGVLNDQRKKDKRTGKSLIESNAFMLQVLTLLAADVIVSIAPRELIEDYRKEYAAAVGERIREILQKEAQ